MRIVVRDEADSVIWHLMAGTRGGPNRLHILYILSARPHNANQLTKETGLDYKTVKHHLEILEENGLVIVSKEKKYGEMYRLTEFSKEKMKLFEKIMDKLEDLGKD